MYGRGSTGSRCVERRCLVHSPFHSFFTFASLFQCFFFLFSSFIIQYYFFWIVQLNLFQILHLTELKRKRKRKKHL